MEIVAILPLPVFAMPEPLRDEDVHFLDVLQQPLLLLFHVLCAFPGELSVAHAHQPEVVALKVLQVADHARDAVLHLRVRVGPVVAPAEPLSVWLLPALVPGFLVVLGPVPGLIFKPAGAVVLLPGVALRAVERDAIGVQAVPEVVDAALVFARP